MSHHHHHHHDHDTHTCKHSHEANNEANGLNLKFLVGIVINVLFIAFELLASCEQFTNSNALFADAMHNLSDLFALAFSWLGIYFARKKTAVNYTYGLRKANILITFLNMLLLVWAIGEIVNESVKYLWKGSSQIQGEMVIVIAGVGVLINGFTAWLFHAAGYAHHHHHGHSHDTHKEGHSHGVQDLNIKNVYLHFLADMLISLGVVVTGAIMYVTKWYFLDSYISIAIAFFILYHCRNLILEVVSYALDATPQHISLEEVSNWLATLAGVTEVHDLHIWGISTTETALSAHLVMPNANYEEKFLAEINHHLKEHYHIQHITIQIEKEPCGQDCANEH